MPQPKATPKPKTTTRKAADGNVPASRIDVANLTDAEREKLRAELEATMRPKGEAPDARNLTPRERAIRALLRERDHLEDCPVIENEERAVGRVEAYGEVRPPNPRTFTPAQPVTVARCIECGGSRVIEGTLEAALLAVITTEPEGDGDLDNDLT